jgi:hypothetical protein
MEVQQNQFNRIPPTHKEVQNLINGARETPALVFIALFHE